MWDIFISNESLSDASNLVAGWPDVFLYLPKCSRLIFWPIQYTRSFYRGKSTPKFGATSAFFIKVSKVNNCSIGEKSPNLVTLLGWYQGDRIGRNFVILAFLKITAETQFLKIVFPRKSYALVLPKNGLNLVLGHISTNSSGMTMYVPT
jgi:hypothetical protein